MLEDLWAGIIQFTEQFVVPDWGSLIGLLPVFLLIPVVLYLTWTAYRFATAGPTRRGKRRLPPAPPAGIHMPGPSLAPFLGAVGALFLVLGVVEGGLWLAVGGIILALTLLYWGREALRDFDHIPATATPVEPVVPAGMLPARVGSPPPGVHVPPPSFRPLLVSIAMTILVWGLIVGGWGLAIGFIAIVLTGLGWLRDARHEYRAVEDADRTGHLDLGRGPAWPIATFATLAVLIAVGLLFTSGLLPNSAGAPVDAGQSPAVGGGTTGGEFVPSDAPASLPAADAAITAENIQFTTASVSVPAGKPFTVAFDNRDQAPHDVVITDAGGAQAFKGEVVTGPKVVVYDVPALQAGTYTFVCSVHPNMTGSITAD